MATEDTITDRLKARAESLKVKDVESLLELHNAPVVPVHMAKRTGA